MLDLVANRLPQVLITLLLVSAVIFVAVQATGNPVNAYLPPDAGEAQRQALIEQLGLNDPVLVQYVRFLSRMATGDFGTSLRYQRPALEVVLQHLPLTALLTLLAMTVSVLVGVTLGSLAGARPHGVIDYLILNLSSMAQALPTFWIGIMLILLFSVRWQLLPTTGGGTVQGMLLPAVTLATFLTPPIVLLTRSSILETHGEQYIAVARSKGLSERVVLYRHALRNALVPVVSLVGVELGALLGGAVIVETVFSMPGLGYLTVQAVYYRDMPIVQGAVLTSALGVIITSIVVDWVNSRIDPRLRA